MTQLSQKQVIPKCDELKQLVAQWFVFSYENQFSFMIVGFVRLTHSTVVLEFCHE